MAGETKRINGKEYNVTDVHAVWNNRRKDAEEDRKSFLTQIKVNRMFAAGKQSLDWNQRDGRVVEVRMRGGIEQVVSPVLDQYIGTVIGRLASTDYKPNWLVARNDAQTEDLAQYMNSAFTWGWDHEWLGDEKVLTLLRGICIDGTYGIRVRYDRRKGELAGDVPWKDGSPILDKKAAAEYVAEQAEQGKTAKIAPVREGKVVWEMLPAECLYPPPGYEDPKDFPHEIIGRPVSVAEVKNRYGDMAEDVTEEEIDNSGALTAGYSSGSPAKITGKVMVYTGYEKPNAQYKKGLTVVFTDTALLDVYESLPLSDHPLGPRCGVHYFRWSILPGRFWGKAFIENGIGGQKILNKRYTQMNAMIDRNMPVTYIEEQSLARRQTGEPFEYVEVRPGAPLPKTDAGIQLGSWWVEEVKLQEQAIEKALGIRGVSMGQAPQGVSAYSAMALLSENDSLKLDPVGQDFRLRMVDASWDTMEFMRNWPPNKRLWIAGPENRLQEFTFDKNKIPERYLVRPPRGGSLPRSQAAEIQKINDIWAASGGKLPLTWYINSLNQGKPQDLPPSIGDSDSHKAELENIIMLNTLEAPPVAPYDDDARHGEIHRAFQMQMKSMADQGDEKAAQVVAVLEQHVLEHESSAQQIATQVSPAPQMMPPQPPQGMEGMGAEPTPQSQAAAAPPPVY